MKLDFTFKVKGLDGKEVDETSGSVIAQLLAVKSPGIEPMKAYDWATKLYAGKPLEIDKQDAKKLHKFILDNDSMTNLFKCQLAEYVDDCIGKENE